MAAPVGGGQDRRLRRRSLVRRHDAGGRQSSAAGHPDLAEIHIQTGRDDPCWAT